MFRLFHHNYRLFFVLLTVFFSAALWTVASAQDDTATDVQTCVPAQPDGWVPYIVQAGDSLSGIAVRSASTIQVLQRTNCLTNPRWIVAGTQLFVPRELTPDPYQYFLGRCLDEDFTSAQCRRMFNAYNGEDNGFTERCLSAGFTSEECSRMSNRLQEEANLQARCRNAGLDVEECRLMNANQNGAQTGDLDGTPDRDRDRDRDHVTDDQAQQDRSTDRQNQRG